MAYNFRPQIQSLVDENMALGGYRCEDHLLEAALHVLSDYHASVKDIGQGIMDYQQDKVEPIDAALEDVRKQLRSNL